MATICWALGSKRNGIGHIDKMEATPRQIGWSLTHVDREVKGLMYEGVPPGGWI